MRLFHRGSCGHGSRQLAATAAARLLALLMVAVASALSSNDAAVLLRLRDAMRAAGAHDWGSPGVPLAAGANSTDDPCDWEQIRCRNSTVVGITHWDNLDEKCGQGEYMRLPGSALAELARLPGLEKLHFMRSSLAIEGGLPAAWTAPGAFPRLRALDVHVCSLLGPAGAASNTTALPSLQPGTWPELEGLGLSFLEPPAALPPRWADPGVLPSLQRLSLSVTLQGQLPPEWARGFGRLTHLMIADLAWVLTVPVPGNGGTYTTAAGGDVPADPRVRAQQRAQRRWLPAAGAPAAPPAPAPAPAPASAAPQRHLPAEWASGFRHLGNLILNHVGLSGTIPPSWLAPGAFPRLFKLQLAANQLTGTLPPGVFQALPALTHLMLQDNCFSGTLPQEWASSAAQFLHLSYNNLTGPALPAEWTRPGAMRQLTALFLSGNQRLNGSLPKLPWPQLQHLHLDGTGMAGSVSSSWCNRDNTRPYLQSNLWLNHTALVVPPCLAKSAPPAAPRRDGGRPAWPLLLVLAALVCAGTAGRLLWLRRQQCRRAYQPIAEREAAYLDSFSSAGSKLSGRGSGRGSASATDSGTLAPGAVLQRRARLAAILSSHGIAAAGIEMLPLEALSPALAHRFGAPGADASLQPGLRRPWQRWLPQPVAGAVELSAAAAGWRRQGAGDAGAGAGGAPASWGWGLQTHSLALPPRDLQFVTDSQGELVVLGEGGYAVVFQGRLPATDVAVKVFELLPGTDLGLVWAEAALMRDCVHPRIVPLYGVARKGPLLMLVMKLLRGGSLHHALGDEQLRPQLAWRARGRAAALDLAGAVHFLHSRGVMHSDLSSMNVLLDEACAAYVADLGVARVAGQHSRSVAGFSRTHAAPEQLLGLRCTLAVDVYSLGLILVQLTTQQVVIRRGHWRLPRAPEECPQAVLELIEACVAQDPRQRPTAAEVLACLEASEPGSEPG